MKVILGDIHRIRKSCFFTASTTFSGGTRMVACRRMTLSRAVLGTVDRRAYTRGIVMAPANAEWGTLFVEFVSHLLATSTTCPGGTRMVERRPLTTAHSDPRGTECTRTHSPRRTSAFQRRVRRAILRICAVDRCACTVEKVKSQVSS